MKTSDITIVFQGAFKAYTQRDSPSVVEVVKRTRKVLPGAKLILSTWDGAEVPDGLLVDEVVFSPDPGALAPLKLTDQKANNINRQIVSSHAGMQAVRTPYAVKMRTDSFLEHAGFIDYFEAQVRRDSHARRFLSTAFFTLDPDIFERISFHISDWFQFGLTEVLQDYWNVPLMTAAAGRHYEAREHAPNSNVFEKWFRAEFAVEQYICMHYAESIGYRIPKYINDTSPVVLADARRFIADETLVLDPWQCGVIFPKYGWVNDSVLQKLNNIMHIDWLRLSGQLPLDDRDALDLSHQIKRRQREKAVARWFFASSRPLHDVMFEQSARGRFLRRQAMRVFRIVRGGVQFRF